MCSYTVITLRPYQIDMIDNINSAWRAGHRNVLATLPTGAGKTVIFTRIMADHGEPCIAIAHRQELVGQISLALGSHGVKHRIIGQRSVIRFIIQLHIAELGRPYFDPGADVAVASVDTFIRRQTELRHWLPRVTLWVQDEAHHILRDNKWGKAAGMVPNARGLGVSASPTRADGHGLGSHAHGLMDVIVEGPSMRELITQGFLTDYRVFAPSVDDLDLSDVPVTPTGDYSGPKLKTAVRRSRIVGDVVDHYRRIAHGKLGLTFVTDIETASDTARAYRAAGISAEVITYKSSDRDRASAIQRFRRRETMQLVNVDLFGEGFDLPAVEVVSFARPTQSYGLYIQQFGRALRPSDGKRSALVIDHVGNVIRHGLPDANRVWTLDRRQRNSATKPQTLLKVCPGCTRVYERFYKLCPYCGYYAAPLSRSIPMHVDGDLTELDAATLATMRGDINTAMVDGPAYRANLVRRNCPTIALNINVKRHQERRDAQLELRGHIAQWAGYQRAFGRPDSESYRRFYLLFGIDVLTAQTLGKTETIKLSKKIVDNVNDSCQTLTRG